MQGDPLFGICCTRHRDCRGRRQSATGLRTAAALIAPSGPVEALLAERVVNSAWRLRRTARAEVAVLHRGVHKEKISRWVAKARSLERPPLPRFDSDGPVITNKESHAKATRALDHLYAERDRDEVLIGGAVEADAQSGCALGLLARY